MPEDVIVSPHQNTPNQAAQAAEGAARERTPNAMPPDERAVALAGTEGDGAAQDPGVGAAAADGAEGGAEPPRKPPVAKSLSDVRRDEINARFRARRAQANAEEKDDISEFARTAGLPPEFAALQPAPGEPEPATAEPASPDAAEPGEPAAAAEPVRTVRIKVRGEEREVSLEEALAKAQIAYASEDTLEQAKAKFKELDTLVELARDRVQRPGPTGEHHAAAVTQPNERTPAADPAASTPEDPFGKLLETMQFGDPEEAKALLRNTIVTTAQQVSRQTAAADRIREDAVKAAEILTDFREKHQEIAEDAMANAAIEAKIIQLQAEDLKAVNVDLSKLRQDGKPATPADIANAHQFFRANGHRVRSPAQMLETATGEFLKWKGATPKPAADPPQPTPQPGPAAPAKPLEVVVERSARKAAIPQQPSRTNAPRSEPQQTAPLSRSAVVQRMKAQRALKRGQNLGLGQGG